MNRRSFLASVVTALAMSPFLCRMAEAFQVEQIDVPIEEMKSGWDGSISPRMYKNYNWGIAVLSEPIDKLSTEYDVARVVREEYGNITIHWGERLPVQKMVEYQPPSDEEIQKAHREFLENRTPLLAVANNPKAGSFEDICFSDLPCS